MSSRKTSTTAYAVVTGLSSLARMPRWRPYFSDEMIRLNTIFARYACDSGFKRLIAVLPPALFVRLMDALYVPGMAYHYLFRKRLIEGEAEIALAAGVQQIVILGAGLDTLALRLAKKYPAAVLFEIDLPGTQHGKLDALRKANYAIPPNCVFKAVDLSKTKLETAFLTDAQFRPDAPTLVVIEGVLMYLAEPEVRVLFTGLQRLFTGSLTVVFGAIASPDSEGSLGLRLTSALLRRGREETKWHCASHDMQVLMGSLGYTLASWTSYKELQRGYREESELTSTPEEDENYYVVAKIPLTQRDAAHAPI